MAGRGKEREGREGEGQAGGKSFMLEKLNEDRMWKTKMNRSTNCKHAHTYFPLINKNSKGGPIFIFESSFPFLMIF